MTSTSDEVSVLLGTARADGDWSTVVAVTRATWPELVVESPRLVRSVLDDSPAGLWEHDPALLTAYAASFRTDPSPARSAALRWFAAARRAVDADTSVHVRANLLAREAAALRSLGRWRETGHTLDELDALAEQADSVRERMTLEARSAVQRGIRSYHLGDYDDADRLLHLATGLSRSGPERDAAAEGLAVLSLIDYAMGRFDDAATHAAEAAGIRPRLAPMRLAPATISAVLMAVERGDLPLAESLLPDLIAAAAGSDWEPLAHYADAARHLLAGRYVDGLDAVRRCTRAYRPWQSPGGILTMAEGLRGTLLLRMGERESAWDVYGALHPTHLHANCPARFVAHLRLITGDARGALDALRDCERLGDVHSLRSLVDVLLVQAAALLELGDDPHADVAFEQATRLAVENGVRLPFRLVPEPLLTRLAARAITHGCGPEVAALLRDVRGAGAPHEPAVRLSRRERDILSILLEDASVADAADRLFISVNTVKTHLKSAYRKLGVSTRPAAVRKARELGLHIDITRDSPDDHPGAS